MVGSWQSSGAATWFGSLSCSLLPPIDSCATVAGVVHIATYLSELGVSSSAFVDPMLLLLEVLLSESGLLVDVANFFPNFWWYSVIADAGTGRMAYKLGESIILFPFLKFESKELDLSRCLPCKCCNCLMVPGKS